MKLTILGTYILWLLLVFGSDVSAKEGGSYQRPVGEKAARKYFKKSSRRRRQPAASDVHFMAIHLGNFVNSTSYRWGDKKQKSIAKFNGGITYRMGEWKNSMDLLLRVDFTSYEFDATNRATKMSILPVVTFPDVNSRFPIYFGGGVGLGIFFKQLEEESSLAIDYQLIAGLRFLNVFETTGFFVESGLKNHIHILSDGQLNGVFIAGGAVFTF